MKTNAPTYPSELLAALARGDAGDPSALAEVQQGFDEHPELIDQLGHLASNAQNAVVGLIAGRSLTAQEAVRRSLEELRQKLLATASSPLERLLVERVVLAHAWVCHGDLDLAARLAREPGSSPACRASAKRLDQAQRRFLAATKTLAIFQKLLPRVISPVQLLAHQVPEGPGELVPAALRRRCAGTVAGQGVD